MTSLNDIIGIQIVGYRYGIAPESGRSYNFRDNSYECGVSMASVGYDKEIRSFAVDEADKKKYYYIGTVCGEGGDDEICLENVVRITRNEYIKKLKEMKEASNAIVNYRFDRKINLINNGFNLGLTEEEIEAERVKYLR